MGCCQAGVMKRMCLSEPLLVFKKMPRRRSSSRGRASRGRQTSRGSRGRSSRGSHRLPHRLSGTSRTSRTRKSIDKLKTKPVGVPNVPWKQLTAMKISDRRQMPKHCFLDNSDPAHPKYPTCFTGSDQPSCTGLQAAIQRGRMQHNQRVVQRAESLEAKIGCNLPGKWEHREANLYARSRRSTRVQRG
jgi:hypothetical protein